MGSKMMLLLVAALALSINAVNGFTVDRPFPSKEGFGNTQLVSNGELDEDFDDEPVFEPRFLPFFENNAATIGKVLEAIQNPGNSSLQDTLINVISDVVLTKFGGDETVKNVIKVVKNAKDKTFKEIIMDVAAEVAIGKLGVEDDVIRKVAEVLKNPGDQNVQQALINLAANVADSKLKGDGTLMKVAEVLQKPGNRTLQENLLNVVFEVGVAKYGDNALFKTVAEVYKSSGDKSVEENLINLATSVALTQYGNNPIIKMLATSLKNSNGSIAERLTSVADAALTAGLGPVQAAIFKQGIGVAGQALKVGGGLLGGALADMGGDSPLGKVGRAISEKSSSVGGFMSNFGGGDKGIGAVIGKFGESLKGNATIQEALSAINTPVATVESHVSEGLEQIAKVEEKVSEVAQNEALSDTIKAVTVPLLNENTLTPSIEVLPEALKETTKDVKVEKAEEINTPVDVVQPVFVAARNAMEDTSASEHVTVEENSEPLTTAEQQLGSIVDQLIGGEEQKDAAVNQGMILPEQATVTSAQNIQGVDPTVNNLVGSSQIAQSYSLLPTNSLSGNSYSHIAVNQGEGTMSNYGGQVGSGSYSMGALGTAAEAIQAARLALQAGGDALGGALGSTGISVGQNGRVGGTVKNIEITQVKLKMM